LILIKGLEEVISSGEMSEENIVLRVVDKGSGEISKI
jgi:hypothetical protein